jgi:hypothetical protein
MNRSVPKDSDIDSYYKQNYKNINIYMFGQESFCHGWIEAPEPLAASPVHLRVYLERPVLSAAQS